MGTLDFFRKRTEKIKEPKEKQSLLAASCISNFFVVGSFFFYFVKIFISSLYTCYIFSSLIKIQEKGYP